MELLLLIGIAGLVGVLLGVQMMSQRPPQVTVVQVAREDQETGGCGGFLLLFILLVIILGAVANAPLS